MDRCPDYLPAAVWDFYRELGDRELINARDRAVINRLFGFGPAPLDRNGRPEIALTWRRVRKLDGRQLLSLLLSVRVSIDREAREALRECRELMPEIAETADKLAALVETVNQLSGEHRASIPGELLSPLDWIERAGFPIPAGLWKSPTTPADMLRKLALAARDYHPACTAPNSPQAESWKPGRIPGFIRHFDARWADTFGRAGALSDMDAARFAGAILGLPVSREAVKAARER